VERTGRSPVAPVTCPTGRMTQYKTAPIGQQTKFVSKTTTVQVVLISLASMAALSISAPVPEADPEAFLNLGAVAIPAITGSALIDGLLLGKVAFLKAAILANLLLGSGSADELADSSDASYVAPQDDYGVPYEPPVNSYGAPAVSYEEPAPSYEAPSYEAPAPSYESPAPSYDAPAAPSYEAPSYEAPQVADTYGSPQADPLPSYGAPARF